MNVTLTFLHNGKQIPSTFRRKVEIEIFFIFPACFVSFTVNCEEGMRMRNEESVFWRILANKTIKQWQLGQWGIFLDTGVLRRGRAQDLFRYCDIYICWSAFIITCFSCDTLQYNDSVWCCICTRSILTPA